jgi:hydrogenase nickel incorporation protein HypB
MKSLATEQNASEAHPRSRVPIVAVVGPPGAGKTVLLETTIRDLRPKLRVAVIAAHPAADRDAAHYRRYCAQVEAVNSARPGFREVGPALGRIDWAHTDMVFIESVGGIAGRTDLGQDVTVTVLAVSGGDDKAAEYGELLAASRVLILTKTDLRSHVTFDMNSFCKDVQRINPTAEVIELSAYENETIKPWLNWLDRYRQEKDPFYWPAGNAIQPAESFFG